MLEILIQRLAFLHHKSVGFVVSFPQCRKYTSSDLSASGARDTAEIDS